MARVLHSKYGLSLGLNILVLMRWLVPGGREPSTHASNMINIREHFMRVRLTVTPLSPESFQSRALAAVSL